MSHNSVVKIMAHFFAKLLLLILSLWSVEGVYYVKLTNSDVCAFEGGVTEMPIIAKKIADVLNTHCYFTRSNLKKWGLSNFAF